MIRELTERLVGLAKREHYHCEDGWYTCPKHPEGSINETKPDECDCGADDHNKLVDQIAAQLFKVMPTDGDVIHNEAQETPPLGGSADSRVWKLPELKR